jgi:hypothetical protein
MLCKLHINVSAKQDRTNCLARHVVSVVYMSLLNKTALTVQCVVCQMHIYVSAADSTDCSMGVVLVVYMSLLQTVPTAQWVLC